MISQVSVCLLAHDEIGLISDTFRHTKWEYSFSVDSIPNFVETSNKV